jgi:hypothetical protein
LYGEIMARAESKMIMGYLPIEERHHPALLSLVSPAHIGVRLLDLFAGEGAFLNAAANAWRLTPYANELDGERDARLPDARGRRDGHAKRQSRWRCVVTPDRRQVGAGNLRPAGKRDIMNTKASPHQSFLS